MNTKVKIANITFKNPVTVASGTFGHAEKYFNLEEVKRLGAIVPKTVTFHAQVGNPPVRIIEKLNSFCHSRESGNPSIAAVELNLSCPNLKHKTLVAQDPQATQALVG